MKILIALALSAAAACLAGCGTLTGGESSLDTFNQTLKELATDPRCGHTDRLQGNLGGLTGNNLSVYLERTCPPAQGANAPATPPPSAEPAPAS
jgi:hypothetical protein